MQPKADPLDVKKFIDSGILEEYCLGTLSAEEQGSVLQMSMLYPEVKQEITAIELSMESFAASNAITAPDSARNKILEALGFSTEAAPLDLNNLPFTDEYSDHLQWLDALKHLIPTEPSEDFLCEVLQQNEQVTQMLVITKADVPEETHDDRRESFFIMKGTCVCVVDGIQYELNPGDFLEIPLHTNHDIKIVTPYVVAILQHLPV